MKKVLTCLLASTALFLSGCNEQKPGGPGVTAPQKTSDTTTTNRPVYGEAAGTFEVNAPSLATRIQQGETTVAAFSLTRGKNFTEDVTLTLTDLPTGVTLDSEPPVIKNSGKEVKITFLAADNATVGDFTAKVVAHPAQGPDATSTMKFTVLKK